LPSNAQPSRDLRARKHARIASFRVGNLERFHDIENLVALSRVGGYNPSTMNLATYIEKKGETVLGFAERAGVSHALVRTTMKKRRTPLLRTAVAIEKATEGSVNAIDLMVACEGGYVPLDPEWRAWWESRPKSKNEIDPAPATRKKRARAV
jgi:hypothetical protein